MPIGDGPDCYNGINKDEDERIKFQEKVDKWWYDLDDNYKFELVEPYYPDKAHLMNIDVMWNGLDPSEKVILWEENQAGYNGI